MVTTTSKAKPLTYADLLKTPKDDGNRYEILAGELVASASPSKRHAWMSFQFARKLADHVEKHGLGVVFHSPVDVRLSRNDVVVPDVIFLSTDRVHLYGEQYVDGAPDLVVEVLSRSTRSRDLTAKLRLYAQAGVQEYWLIDPDLGEITLYFRLPSGTYEVVGGNSDRARSRILFDFEVTTAELVEGLL